MELTDDQRKAQPLLEYHHTVILPKTIDYDAYREMAWVCAYVAIWQTQWRLGKERALHVYCNGDGGELEHTMAIVDLIKQFHAVGVLIGEAASAHSVIWAACQERVAYSNAWIAIHNGAYTFRHKAVQDGWVRQEGDDAILLGEKQKENDLKVAQIYANASNKPADWWGEKMRKGGLSMLRIEAQQLVQELDMARWINS